MIVSKVLVGIGANLSIVVKAAAEIMVSLCTI